MPLPSQLSKLGELNSFSPRQIGFLGFKTINVDATGSETWRESKHTERRRYGKPGRDLTENGDTSFIMISSWVSGPKSSDLGSMRYARLSHLDFTPRHGLVQVHFW